MTPIDRPLGPLLIDLEGPTLQAWERRRLEHPAVGGVILFARNCQTAAQVRALCTEIHGLRNPPLLIAIDQEGGRVQRLREGVTPFPPQASLGRLAEREGLPKAVAMARIWGELLAWELRELGIDVDFTPCVDLDRGISSVIGDRALHHDPEVVSALACALWAGLQQQGITGVAKHFPGHGGVTADSHCELPEDRRSWDALQEDLRPFQRLIAARIPAMMTAHVRYPAVDDLPASFSPRWLTQILRHELGFTGVLISDDLSMGATLGLGSIEQRVDAALAAGCDLLLLCNDPDAVDQALAHLPNPTVPHHSSLLAGKKGALCAHELSRYRQQIEELASL
ncbi:MAG: beta-N-acetylhexosaminidase [Acidithiobacillus sp.]|nr:beta-N-acetylhexosaminidase [Acidithiobacillus sp.]